VNQQIPLIDVKAQYAPLIPELEERFSACSLRAVHLRARGGGVRARGGRVPRVPHAIGVANGTDALVLALEALGIGRGDEVVCPSFTFYATARRSRASGATPVFADIDP
jgi:hypothetical protein